MTESTYEYLTVGDQERIIAQLKQISRNSPLRDKLFFEHGELISCASLFCTSMVFWRASFRGFGLYRYGKGRICTLIVSSISCIHGAFVHNVYVKSKLTDLYRSESMLAYGARSVVFHQYGLFTSFAFTTVFSFIFGQRSGVIPVPNQMFKRENRPLVYNYFITKLRPYYKSMGIACLMSTMIMGVVGMNEYRDSERLLSKIAMTSLYKRQKDNQTSS